MKRFSRFKNNSRQTIKTKTKSEESQTIYFLLLSIVLETPIIFIKYLFILSFITLLFFPKAFGINFERKVAIVYLFFSSRKRSGQALTEKKQKVKTAKIFLKFDSLRYRKRTRIPKRLGYSNSFFCLTLHYSNFLTKYFQGQF